MKHLLSTLAIAVLLAGTYAFLSTPALADSGVSPLQQFIATTTPSSAITQSTFGKALKITGLTTGLCLTLDANHLLTTTPCGSEDAASYSFPLDGNGTTTLTQFYAGLTGFASSTVGGATQTTGLTVSGGATSTLKHTFLGDIFSNQPVTSNRAFVVQSPTGTSTVQFSTIDTNSNLLQVATSTGTNYFVVTAAGNVGIASSSPSNKLDVGGNILLSGLLTSTGTGTSTFTGGVVAPCFATPGSSTCIGATAVSSVSNSDSTITCSPTTGNVVCSLNLSHANSWAILQAFPSGLSINGTSITAVTGTGSAVLAAGSTLSGNTTIPTIRGGTGVANALSLTGTTNVAPNSSSGITFNYGVSGNSEAARLVGTTGFIGFGTTSPFAQFSINTLPGATGATPWIFAIASSTPTATSTLFHITNTGAVVQDSAAAQAGQAMCYATGGVFGHCTSAVGAGGACTCVAN